MLCNYNRFLRAAVFLALLVISGCSVKPLYDDATSCDGKSSSIKVDVIANRDGQKLRSYLIDYLRDINFTDRKLRLTVKLSTVAKSFALDHKGEAHRLLSTSTAKVILRDENKKVIMDKNISMSTSYNIARAQGEVMLSLYGRMNAALLKELARRIVENIRINLEK